MIQSLDQLSRFKKYLSIITYIEEKVTVGITHLHALVCMLGIVDQVRNATILTSDLSACASARLPTVQVQASTLETEITDVGAPGLLAFLSKAVLLGTNHSFQRKTRFTHL